MFDIKKDVLKNFAIFTEKHLKNICEWLLLKVTGFTEIVENWQFSLLSHLSKADF